MQEITLVGSSADIKFIQLICDIAAWHIENFPLNDIAKGCELDYNQNITEDDIRIYPFAIQLRVKFSHNENTHMHYFKLQFPQYEKYQNEWVWRAINAGKFVGSIAF